MDSFNARWLVVVVLTFMLLAFLYRVAQPKSAFNSALRDSGANSAYSFSKAQLLWWTVIISMCFAIAYAVNGEAEDVIDGSNLVLLGISVGTIAAGRVIDNGDESNPKIAQRHQTCGQEHSFLIDILSDYNGISLHRFQALIFNVVFGLAFVMEFLSGPMDVLPQYDPSTLGLIGLSSGGYLALKVNENNETMSDRIVTDMKARQQTTTPPAKPADTSEEQTN